MQATLGYILQAGPTEFADSLDAVSPRRPSSLDWCPGTQRSLRVLLPPALALTMSLSATPLVLLGVCFFAGFCPGHIDTIC